jgi:hypothetical protein
MPLQSSFVALGCALFLFVVVVLQPLAIVLVLLVHAEPFSLCSGGLLAEQGGMPSTRMCYAG